METKEQAERLDRSIPVPPNKVETPKTETKKQAYVPPTITVYRVKLEHCFIVDQSIARSIQVNDDNLAEWEPDVEVGETATPGEDGQISMPW